MTGATVRARDGPVGCGWLVRRRPDRCCTLPAKWIVTTAIRGIGLCDSHYQPGVRWATSGGRYRADVEERHPDEPTTLF